jgi:hypothetical protein
VDEEIDLHQPVPVDQGSALAVDLVAHCVID